MNMRFEAPFAEDPTTTGSVTASAVGDPPWVTAEQFSLRSVSPSTRSIPPGETITVEVEYGSDFNRRFPQPQELDLDHPDYCEVERLGFNPGADLFVRASAATSDASDGDCWLIVPDKSTTETLTVAVPLTGGTETITVELVGGSTREVYDSDTVEVQVDEAAPEPPDRPDPPEDDPGNGGGGDGPLSGLFPDSGELVGPLVLLVVILVALLYIGVTV